MTACAQCGEQSFTPAVAVCYDCADQDIVTGVASGLHKAAIDILRGFDRAQYANDLVTAWNNADAALETAQGQTPALADAVKAAVAAERKAEDRARNAAGYQQRCEDAQRKTERDKASPQRKTEALTAARSSAEVAQGEQAAFAEATAARQQAETALAAHQQRVQGLEDTATKARAAMEHPPAQVPMSPHTLFAGHPLFLLAQPDVTDDQRVMARLGIQVAADMSGLSDQLLAEGRAQGREAAEDEAKHRPHVLSSPDGTRTGLIASPLPGRFQPGRR